MKITIAVPWTDPVTEKRYEPDSSPDVRDDIARLLIHDGWARPYAGPVKKGKTGPPPTPSADSGPQPPPRTGKGSGTQEWVDYASAHGVAVAEGTGREEIVAALDAAGVPTGPPAQPDSPDQGDNEKED